LAKIIQIKILIASLRITLWSRYSCY